MSIKAKRTRRIWLAAAVAASVVGLTTRPSADGPGKSFLFLQSPYTQELFGVSSRIDPVSYPAGILGGVAFAPDEDVWSSECNFWGGTRLHRFDSQQTDPHPGSGTPLHHETIVDLTGSSPYGTLFPGGIDGCGLVNHPDDFMYMNSRRGLWRLDPASGKPINPTTMLPIDPGGATGGAAPLGNGGNALGIAVDPTPDQDGHHHIVYVGNDCHPSLDTNAPTCTFYDFEPATGVTKVFARLNRNPDAYVDPPFGHQDLVDGIYFDPSGQFVFAAYRAFGTSHGLMIVQRPASLLPLDASPTGQLGSSGSTTRFVPMTSMETEPDGVAFHTGDAPEDNFVVTLDESSTAWPACQDTTTGEITPRTGGTCPDQGTTLIVVNGGTMTRFDFDAGNFLSGAVTQTMFGAGGFRGDLLQVGPDRCIYATQGQLHTTDENNNPIVTNGVRYDDGSLDPSGDNLNSIVRICGGFAPPAGVEEPPVTGGISGYAYVDANRNSVFDSGEPPLAGVVITLSGSAVATTAADGSYGFTGLAAASYVVSAPAEASNKALATLSPLPVGLATGQQVTNVNFGYVPGAVSGHVYVDWNRNGLFDVGEPIIPNVPVTLTGGGTMPTDANGSYAFTGVDGGSHTVAAPPAAGEYVLGTPSPLPVTLPPGQTIPNLDFGYVAPDICYAGTTHPEVGASQRVTINTDATGTPTTVTIGTIFSRNFADNTYGVNAIGWSRGHTFSNLTGSDHIELALFDGSGATKLKFDIDYISASTAVPSGYKSLCVAGGDGGMLIGSASDVVNCRTSIGDNFNTSGYVLTANSPATDANYTPNPAYPNWIFDVWYEVTVKMSAFGSAGFGKPLITEIHASPSKTGSNTEIVGPCVPGGDPPPPGSCQISQGTVSFKSNQVKLPLTNTGATAALLTGLANLSWPSANGKLKQVKLDGGVVWSGAVTSPASITSAMLTTTASKKTIAAGQKRTLVLVFEKTANTNVANYSGSVTFDTGCELSLP